MYSLLVFVVSLTGSVVEALECISGSPSSEFSRHSVVQPVILHGRTRREIFTTTDTSGAHHPEVTIKILTDDEEYFLDLRQNQDLVTADHILSYQEKDETVVHKYKKEELDLCHYSGSVRGKPGSWVTVSTCHGIQGMVSDGERVIYIEPVQGTDYAGALNGPHYIYDHNDLFESHPGKEYYTISNTSLHKVQTSLQKRNKRHASSDQLIRSPYGANEQSLYVELALVVDKRHYEYHKRNLRSIHNEMKTIANHMNATCRVKSLGTVCRAANHECDLPEYCSGDSAYCPDDVYKMDTTPCMAGNESAYCVNGNCQTHAGQCRALWGSSGKSCPNASYNENMRLGFGDCGYDRIAKSYGICLKQDVMCGRLFCTHLSESFHRSGKPLIGPDDNTRTIQSRTSYRVFTCQVVTIDLGLSVPDFGLVPDGAICGDGMMCLNQKCVSVSAIRERIKHLDSSVCPSNCSGHGVCNSLGHCHCDLGFAPPLCSEPGAGGSSDSEPASDISILKRLQMALYIIFLGIVPAITLILLAVYCSKNNVFKWQHLCKLNSKSKDGNTTTKNVCETESTIYANNEIFCTSSSKNGGTNFVYNSSAIYANVKEISTPKIQRLVKNDPQVKATKPIIVVQHELVSNRTEKIKPQPLPKPSSGTLPNKNRPTVAQVKDINLSTNKTEGRYPNNSLGNSLAEALKKRNEEKLTARSRNVVL